MICKREINNVVISIWFGTLLEYIIHSEYINEEEKVYDTHSFYLLKLYLSRPQRIANVAARQKGIVINILSILMTCIPHIMSR